MRGDLKSAWPYVWGDVWVRLYETKDVPVELFSELYAALIPKPKAPTAPSAPTIFDANGKMVDPTEIAADAAYKKSLEDYNVLRLDYEKALTAKPEEVRTWFREQLHATLTTEADAIRALEKAFVVIEDIGGDALSNRYVNLVQAFIEKYNLRYDLRRPFSLHPTISGVFTQLICQLQNITLDDTHLNSIMGEFEESFRELKNDSSPGKIKTCIHRQMNLLEALTQRCPNVNHGTLGAMCNDIQTWPHIAVKDAMKKLYGFSSDYPGIRHAGNPISAIREIEMRDLIGMSVILSGFVPYLSHRINAFDVFQGGNP